MKYVNSGNGKLPLISLIAILSISLTVNLPGLAISPIEGKLNQVFPNASDRMIQLLTLMPNLVIIPFMLCAGKIANFKNQIRVLCIGLSVYICSGVLYFFASSLMQLIVLGCLLGIGCGLIIPIAASLIAQRFSGMWRVKILGWKSGVSNFTVIFATLFVGWMASYDWHYCFIVYMIPVIPLCLLPFITNAYMDKHQVPASQPTDLAQKTSDYTSADFHFSGRQSLILLVGLIGIYIALTYGTSVVSYYIPFTMEYFRLSSGDMGVATAAYFMGITLSGFSLTYLIRWLGKATPYVAIAMCVFSLLLVGLLHFYITYLIGILIMGVGYGIMQPIIYDKATYIAPNAEKSTQYFSYVLTGNYVALAIVPVIVNSFAWMFRCRNFETDMPAFPYLLNCAILLILIVIAFAKHKSFLFKINSSLYK